MSTTQFLSSGERIAILTRRLAALRERETTVSAWHEIGNIKNAIFNCRAALLKAYAEFSETKIHGG